jgi:hypothetical protein
MGEKDPYLILRSQQDPNYTHDYWGEEYFSTDRQKALQNTLMLTNMPVSITFTFMMLTMITSTTNTTILKKVTLMKVGKVNGITIPCIIMGHNPKKILRNRLKVRKTIASKEKACC